jgi:hypothetical protein
VKKFCAIIVVALCLQACSVPADPGGPTAPAPSAQNPAPNADPKPSNKEQKRYLRFGVEQESTRSIRFSWKYGLLQPNRPTYPEGFTYHEDYEASGQGVATVEVVALEKHSQRMRCTILFRSDVNHDWQIAAEEEGTDRCIATATIS